MDFLQWVPRATVLVVLAATGCSSGEAGPPVVPVSAPATILANRQVEPFNVAVRDLKTQVSVTRAAPATDVPGIGIALRHLADAIQALPRGASVVPVVDSANAIRADALRVGSPGADGSHRTAAARRALEFAASTLHRVAAEAYQDIPELALETADLESTINSIDRSQLLDHERQKFLQALYQTIAILEKMDQATPPHGDVQLRRSGGASVSSP